MNPDIFRKVLQDTKNFSQSLFTPNAQNQTESDVMPQTIDNSPLAKIMPFLGVLSKNIGKK